MQILEVLWRKEQATVREVHEALHAQRGTGYTTVLKLMQIMAQKQLLDRDESRRSHVYRPRVAREDIQGSLLGDLVERAFSGSTSQLVMRALSSGRASKHELDQIRALLDRIEPTHGEGAGEGAEEDAG